MNTIEIWFQRIGGIVGVTVLAAALFGIWRASLRKAGRETGDAKRMLRLTTYLLIAIPYFLVCILLWKPIPSFFPSSGLHNISMLVGALFYFLGLMLYLWAWFKLGRYYNVSSGFGVRLFADHRLLTEGPYAIVRHPMYLGLQVAALGGIFLFRSWTFVFLFFNFLFLIIRARREEQALAMEYPELWEKYSRDVPAWLPKLRKKKSS